MDASSKKGEGSLLSAPDLWTSLSLSVSVLPSVALVVPRAVCAVLFAVAVSFAFSVVCLALGSKSLLVLCSGLFAVVAAVLVSQLVSFLGLKSFSVTAHVSGS